MVITVPPRILVDHEEISSCRRDSERSVWADIKVFFRRCGADFTGGSELRLLSDFNQEHQLFIIFWTAPHDSMAGASQSLCDKENDNPGITPQRKVILGYQ